MPILINLAHSHLVLTDCNGWLGHNRNKPASLHCPLVVSHFFTGERHCKSQFLTICINGGEGMLRKLSIFAVFASMIGFAVFWILTVPVAISTSALGPHTPDLGNGRTMFQVGGCASCHAIPGQDDKTRLGGGLGLQSPFGTFYVPNISPDLKDGIGAWTEAQFVSALTKGTSSDGRHYYPAFPYPSYQRIKLEDLSDLFAYLRTLPVVQGTVREHDLPFPFNIRRALGVWKLLFLDGEPFKPDPDKPMAWNRGAYLVNGPGHCAECHSSRNFLER